MRFAPVLAASLLLHLAVIIAATGVNRQESQLRSISERMAVEYLESGTVVQRQPDSSSPRHVAAPSPAQPVAETKRETAVTSTFRQTPATVEPVRQSTPLQGVPVSFHKLPVEQNWGIATGAAGAPSKGADAPLIAEQNRAADAGTTLQTGNGAMLGDYRQQRDAYQILLKRLIEAHKEYPQAARRSGREGSCSRRFVLDRSGRLKRVEALSSCGHVYLDEAATRAIESVGTFPPLTDDFKGAEESFTITMKFTLARE